MEANTLKGYRLEYCTDSTPGFTRQKEGKGFVYYDCENKKITSPEIIERINSLAIPPAYTNVWISPKANSHLQATGRDSKQRKQYRYHPQWRVLRQENKFLQMISFGKALPSIREHVDKALHGPLNIDKNQIICAIIYLMDNYFIRIGNQIYEKQNQSYGLTTLRKKHLSLKVSKAILEFEGKNAKPWHVVLKDKHIINLLKKCEALSGYRLFKYLDEQNNPSEITSQEVNEYLQQLTQNDFTAKDFRTWGACRETFYRLTQIPYDESTHQNNLKTIISEVADLLGHTPAICQKNYIYPNIITQWKQNDIATWMKHRQQLLNDKDKLFLQWLESHYSS